MNTARTAASLWLPFALLLLALPSHGSAQVGVIPDDECRCVDPDGNEIENCSCFRTLDRGQFAWTLSNFDTSRPRIGITLSTSADENESQGATIQEVMEDGPADRAGLQEGDVITHLNGHSLFDPLPDEEAEADLDLDGSLPAQRLLHIASELEPGDEVEVRYLRDGGQGVTTLTAENLEGWGGNYVFFREGVEGQWKESMEQFREQWDSEAFREQWKDMADVFEDQNLRNFRFYSPKGEGNVVLWNKDEAPNIAFEAYTEREPFSFYFGSVAGLQLEELNPDLGEYFGTERGVLVTDVDEDSTLGLRAGDVVLRVGDREVTDPSRLRKILSSYDADEEITLLIMRQHREMTVSGTTGR